MALRKSAPHSMDRLQMARFTLQIAAANSPSTVLDHGDIEAEDAVEATEIARAVALLLLSSDARRVSDILVVLNEMNEVVAQAPLGLLAGRLIP